jgi:cob(I)alamin adenosyltransferase
LVGGKKVQKTHCRIEAYGTIDELNTFIAVLLTGIDDRDDREFLLRTQSRLFDIGGYLATEGDEVHCSITPSEVAKLEAEIDRITEYIPPLKTFILPGGCPSNAWAHVCRTVCRRAEREIYRLRNESHVDPNILQYINRLSDYFFVFSRKQNFIHNTSEIPWNKSCI